MDEITVYVATCGVYSDRYIEGVYATPEAAMAANPGGTFTLYAGEQGGYRWRRWMNDLDWSSACSIDEYEVRGLLAAERARLAEAVRALPVEGLGHGLYVWRAAVLALLEPTP